LIFQDPAPPTTSTFWSRVFYYLDDPLIEQNNLKVSIGSLLLALLIIIIAFVISRISKRVFEKRILPKAEWMDVGLRYAVLRSVHYVIIAGGVLYALKVGFAVDLTGVAVVVGFISVGIGFGLQSIAADLVSGFILLFERSLRVGDFLKLGDLEGRVSQINLRSTVVITNDRIAVIVPNSELIKNHLVNWSYHDIVRIKIPVEASEQNEIEEVTKAMIDAARALEKVIDDPPPQVYFLGHYNTLLKFELLAWIKDPHDHQQIRSDVQREMYRIFRSRKLPVPTTQIDVQILENTLESLSQKMKPSP
jgi:potassium-dependent mechanosensitive channel